MLNRLDSFNIFLIIFLFSNLISAQIDSILKVYNDKLLPGASLMIIHKGKAVLKKAYGGADIEDRIGVDTKTNFRLASATKQFTAMSIMILIERGVLQLTNNLTEIFPGFPDYGDKITIKNLLNHTSGLIDYESLIPDTAVIQVKDAEVLKMMYAQDSTYFPPGSKYQYSNTGYAVLAMIVQKISGKSFASFLFENIFDPLGMDNTVAYEKGISEVKNRAFGYSLADNKVERKDQSITSAVLGDGGIYSSVEDLYKWDQALYGDDLVSANLLSEAFTRGILSDSTIFDYGYGWRLENYKDYEIVYHTGSTVGFRTIIYRIPEREFSIILLTNRDEGDTLDLAHKLTDLYSDYFR